MTRTRLRLVLLGGSIDADTAWLESSPLKSLKSAFEVVTVENATEARQLLRDAEPGTVLLGTRTAEALAHSADASATALFQSIGEGAAIVATDGSVSWSTDRWQALPESVQRTFSELCVQTIGDLEFALPSGRTSRKLTFVDGDEHFELTVSPVVVDEKSPNHVLSVVGVLWDVTGTHRLQHRIDAIDAAGAQLMRIEAASISKLNMADRLRLLEERIVRSVHDLLEFDNFEIRLLDRQTNRLELVVAIGLSPLKIGEVIHAEPGENGISGHVAFTGQAYICADVAHDPLYRVGLDNAASSLTVPLRLYDEVIGVFNIESNTLNAFNDNDRQFAQIFGRYIAMAMHILDLMVVERYTTNQQVASNVLGELNVPMDEITRRIDALTADESTDPAIKKELEQIRRSAAEIRNRIEACRQGPKTILGAEQEIQKHTIDPVLEGKRILIADDDEEIVDTVERLLSGKGSNVTTCDSGTEAIAAIEASVTNGCPFDIVISDIKMPDRTGYDIFQSVKRLDVDIPVILITGFGYDPNHSIIRASQEGLHALLFKPFKATQLLELIEKAFVNES